MQTEIVKRESLRGILSDIRTKTNLRISNLELSHTHNLTWLAEASESNNVLLTRAIHNSSRLNVLSNATLSTSTAHALQFSDSSHSTNLVGVKRVSSGKARIEPDAAVHNKENISIEEDEEHGPTFHEPNKVEAAQILNSAKTSESNQLASKLMHHQNSISGEKRVRLSDELKAPSSLLDVSGSRCPETEVKDNHTVDQDSSDFQDKPSILKIPLPPPTPCGAAAAKKIYDKQLKAETAGASSGLNEIITPSKATKSEQVTEASLLKAIGHASTPITPATGVATSATAKSTVLAPLPLPTTPMSSGVDALAALNVLSPIRAVHNQTAPNGSKTHVLSTPGRLEDDSMYLALVNSPPTASADSNVAKLIKQNGAAPADASVSNSSTSSEQSEEEGKKPSFHDLDTSVDSDDTVEMPAKYTTENDYSKAQSGKLDKAKELIAKHQKEQQELQQPKALEDNATGTGSEVVAPSYASEIAAPQQAAEKPKSIFGRLVSGLASIVSISSNSSANEAPAQTASAPDTMPAPSTIPANVSSSSVSKPTAQQSSLRARVEETKGKLQGSRAPGAESTQSPSKAQSVRVQSTAQSANVLSTPSAGQAVPVIRGGRDHATGTSADSKKSPEPNKTNRVLIQGGGGASANNKLNESASQSSNGTVTKSQATPASQATRSRRSNPTSAPNPQAVTPSVTKTAPVAATPRDVPPHEVYARHIQRLVNQRTPPVKREDTYELTDHEDGDSDEDDDDIFRKHKIPAWASNMQQVIAMHRVQLAADPDVIFPPLEVKSCDLNAVFSGYKERPRFRKRTSSGFWTNDHLTKQEIIAANKALGIISVAPVSTPASKKY